MENRLTINDDLLPEYSSDYQSQQSIALPDRGGRTASLRRYARVSRIEITAPKSIDQENAQ